MKTNAQRKLLELVHQIDQLIEDKRTPFPFIKKLLKDVTDRQAAVLLDIHPDSRWLVFSTLDHKRHTAVLDLVNNHTLRYLIGRMTDHDIAQIIDSSPTLVTQKVIGALEHSRLTAIMALVIDEAKRNHLLNYVSYPRRSVGKIMQPEVLTVHENTKASQALDEMSEFDILNGPIYQLYVVNDNNELTGTVPISEVVREPRNRKLRDMYLKKPPAIRPLTSQQKAAQLFQDYDLIEAPVTSKGIPVGRILVDDIIDVLQQEYSEDAQKFAGITADETMDTSVVIASRRRLPWMIANIFLDVIAVSVIMPFEQTIAQLTALAVLMPIVSDMGGNVGIQSLTVSIRSLANDRPDWKLAGRELFKEVRLGTLNGLVLGIIIGLVALVWWGNPFLGIVVAIALFLNTILASVVGGVLPIILRRLKKDPAMMSGAVLTTITDFFGFLIFLSLARALMDYLV